MRRGPYVVRGARPRIPAGSNTSSARRHAAAFCASGSGTRIAVGELLRRELALERRDEPRRVARAAELDALEHLDQPPLARVAQVAAAAHGRGRADVVLLAQQRAPTVRFGCASSVGKETRSSKICAAPGFLGDGLVESTSPSSSTRTIRRCAGIGCTIRTRCRSSSASSFCPQRGEPAGLDLDELPVGAHQVDHVAVDLDLEGVARAAKSSLRLAVQRAFAEHADHVVEILYGGPPSSGSQPLDL